MKRQVLIFATVLVCFVLLSGVEAWPQTKQRPLKKQPIQGQATEQPAENPDQNGKPSSIQTPSSSNERKTQPNLDGTWRGITSQDKKVTFKVEANMITRVEFGWAITLDESCAAHPNVTTNRSVIWGFPDGPLKISDKKFGVTRSCCRDTDTVFTGTFDSDTSVSGDLQIKTAVTSECVGSASITWKATRVRKKKKVLRVRQI